MLWTTNINLNIKDRYYTNALDNKHKLQRKKIFEAGTQKEIVAVSKQLNDWCNEYYREGERAIRGFGRYRLSEEYKHFLRTPTKWSQMSAKNQQNLLKKFYESTLGATLYTKPSGAGKKVGDSGKNKRRVRLPVPELFKDRVALPPPPVKNAGVGEGVHEETATCEERRCRRGCI